MAPKKTHYLGFLQEVPSNKKSTIFSTSDMGRQLMESAEVKSTTKNIFKDQKGKSTTNFKQTYNTGEFLDKRSGRLGYKEEMQFSRTDKYDNKEDGYTHEYETQVKLKHMAYPTKITTGSNSKNKQITYDQDSGHDTDSKYEYDYEYDSDY